LRHVLPVELSRDATCPLFDKMLAEMFSKAADSAAVIDHLLELLGYAVQPRRDRATILYLCGSGANGKSTLLKVIQALVGPDLVWSGKIAAMTQDRFVLPNTRGCLLAIEDDGEPGEKVKTATLKMLCEHKRISTRLVRSTEGISFNSMLMPIVATNGAPQFDDTSHGLRRRLQVIRFDRQFRPDEMKLGLAEEIIATELPGVLLRLIDGLQRLTARGHFAPPPECEAALDDFLQEANPLTQFLAEQCVRDEKAKIALGDLFLALRSWANDAGLKLPFGKFGLRPRLATMGFVVRKSSGIIVEGLRLRSKGEADPPRARQRRPEPVTVRLPPPTAAPGPHA
jgi:putative DNA primase/helicase